MLTGQGAQTPAAPHQAFVSSSATLWCPGSPNGKPPSHDPVWRPSTGLLLMWSQNHNISVVYMTANPVHHRCTKHIEIDIHFVREKVALGEVQVLHMSSKYQFAIVMTKGLPVQLFEDFRSSLCLWIPEASTAGG